MPYTYPVEVRDSALQGRGLFAAADIPKGAVYWVYHVDSPLPIPGLNIRPCEVFTRDQLQAMGAKGQLQEIRKIVQGGIYLKDNDVFLAFYDGSEYMNHSFNPNSQIVYPESKDYRELKSYALRDIKAGEEITEDYSNYFSHYSTWVPRLMEKYNNSKFNFENYVYEKHHSKQTQQQQTQQ